MPHAQSVLDAHADRWFAAIPQRMSRRSYTGEPLSAAHLATLTDLAARFVPWSDGRAHVIAEAPASLFFGIIGAYGGISGAPSALAFAGSRHTRPEAVGYTGEALVLEAAALGIDSCWVAGLFRPHVGAQLVGLSRTERLFAVSALGTAVERQTTKEGVLRGSAHAAERRGLAQIAPGAEHWPAWAHSAVVAARQAPSAMNRQPWRFALEDGCLEVRYAGVDTPRTSKRLDVGIAMLHAQLGAHAEGVTGVWELLPGEVIARFTPSIL